MSRSIDARVTLTDELAMAAQRPVSALTTMRMRNNIAHLVDVAHQQRIYWVASTSDSEFGAAIEGGTNRRVYKYTFPVTITDAEKMPSFALYIGTRFTGTPTGARLEAVIRPYQITPTSNSPITSVWQKAITSGSNTWHNRFLYVDRGWSQYASSNLAFYANTGNGTYLESTPNSFVMAQLEIITDVDDWEDGNVQLIGVDLRELYPYELS